MPPLWGSGPALVAGDTDRELVRRVRAGDRAAFDVLFGRYQHRICALIGRYLSDPAEVEDVAQEAFVKAFRALPRFRGESAFYTWLYRIAVNAARNHELAKKRRPPALDLKAEDAQHLDGAQRLTAPETPETAAMRDELAGEIDRAVADLPDNLRTALMLREFEGLSYEGIAAIMECPVGTVRSRIFRARAIIDGRIGPWLGD